MKKGILLAITAYTLWGILPFYWKLLDHVPAYEILCHRMLWSLVFTTGLLSLRRRRQWFAHFRQNPRSLLFYLLSATILASNWFIFIWAVNSSFILDASLGYFINPLVSILLGVIFLKERLRTGQILAVVIAAAGVLYLTFGYGKFPWIALSLALTFGCYGLLRKTARLNSVEGLSVETAFMFFPALGFIMYRGLIGQSAFVYTGWSTSLLLIFSGAITAVPLILFAAGARRIPLNMIGFIQYITPTLNFFIGRFFYHEPLTFARLLGFVFIWIALTIYSFEGFYFINLKRINKSRKTV
ncbi:MAG TPA: EamA family transporter RarD [Candidatus Marinimicrobia bacterium]|nr:EamA family transporter RarD [Candidatus Neomarinimicrobiota bacterium]